MKATGELLLNESPSAYSVYSKKVRLVGMKRSLSLDNNFIARNRTKIECFFHVFVCLSSQIAGLYVYVCVYEHLTAQSAFGSYPKKSLAGILQSADYVTNFKWSFKDKFYFKTVLDLQEND